MRKFSSLLSSLVFSCGLAAPITSPLPAFADTTTPTTDTQSVVAKPRYRFVGMDLGAGVPDGGYLGLVLRPLYFTQFEWAGTYNGIAPGMRVGLTLDPIPYAISPTITGEVGGTFSGPVPFVSNPPDVEYKYANLLLGLSMGNWRVWRFYLRGGMSWLDMQTHNFSNVLNNSDKSLVIGDPRLVGWAPSFKLGFTYMF